MVAIILNKRIMDLTHPYTIIKIGIFDIII